MIVSKEGNIIEKEYIIDNLKEYILVLEFNDSKKTEEINILNDRISELENEVNSLRQENQHFKSTKAYKIWQKYKKFR